MESLNLQEIISNTDNQTKTRMKKLNFKINDETKQQYQQSRLSILEEDEDTQLKEEYYHCNKIF
jgi:hypothetical protein